MHIYFSLKQKMFSNKKKKWGMGAIDREAIVRGTIVQGAIVRGAIVLDPANPHRIGDRLV